MFVFRGDGGVAAWLAWRMNHLSVILRQPLLVVSKHAEAALQIVKFANFAGNIRLFAKCGGGCVLGFEIIVVTSLPR